MQTRSAFFISLAVSSTAPISPIDLSRMVSRLVVIAVIAIACYLALMASSVEANEPALAVERLKDRVLAEADAAIAQPLPDVWGAHAGALCRQNGVSGTCGPASSCRGGIVKGLCYGNASIRCCVASKEEAKKAGLPKVKPSPVVPKKYVNKQSAAERAAESVMQQRFARFKATHGRKYASAAAEQAAYEIFKVNRRKIIDANDRSRKAHHVEAPFKSDGPFADIDEATFRKHFTSKKSVTTTRTDRGPVEARVINSFVQTEEALTMSHENEDALASVLLQESLPGAACVQRSGVCQAKAACFLAKNSLVVGLCPGTSTCCVPKAKPSAPTPAPSPPSTPGTPPPTPAGPVQPTNTGKTLRPVVGEMIVDWRHKLSPIKSQGLCGACWYVGSHAQSLSARSVSFPSVCADLRVLVRASLRAFAATAVIESAVAMKTGGPAPILSVQQIMDCSSPGTNGCDGGASDLGFAFAKTHHVATIEQVPYRMLQDTCPADETPFASGPTVQSIHYGTDTEVDETKLLAALKANGPMSIVLDAHAWQHYSSGIFPTEKCKNGYENTDHAGVLVGYGVDNGQNFWLVRNSYGAYWGESGFIRLAAGINACGVALYPQYVTLN
jgi:cathepsin L